MSLFNWITSKIRPPAAAVPPTPSGVEALSGEALNSNRALPSVKGSSPSSSSSIPVRSKPVIEDDATKTTVSYAPQASGSKSRFTSAKNINPPPPTSTATTTNTPLVGGDSVPRDEFNGFNKKLESQLEEANTRIQEAYRQLEEQEQRHKRERLNWQQQFSSTEKPSSSSPSKSVQQQTSPLQDQESSLRVNKQEDKAGHEGDLSVSSPKGLPFKLRKLSTELLLGRAEACMILREWSQMEKRSQEAMAMASNLNHEPLTARCWFFLGVANYYQKKWALASDSFEFAKPSVGIYTTAHELRSWKYRVNSAMGLSPAGSIESMSNSPSCECGRPASDKQWEDLGSISSSSSSTNTPLVRSTENVSDIGWMNSESPGSGRSTPENTGYPASPSKESPLPHKRLLRSHSKTILPGTLMTTSIPTHRDRSSSPNPSASIKSGDFSPAPDSHRSGRRPPLRKPGSQSGSSSLEVNGSFSVPPRQPRLYTPGDDHVYPSSPLRQGPRLRVVIPVKTFPSPRPIFSIPLRPSRIYMPDKPDVALYPQKPFRQGERLKVAIPSPEPQTPPLEINPIPITDKSLGYHTNSTGSSAERSPVQPQRPPLPRRLQGREVFSKARSSTTSSSGKFPSDPSNPSLPFRQTHKKSSSVFGENFDDASQFIQELSQPSYTKRRAVNNRISSRSDGTSAEPGNSPEEHSRHISNSAVPGDLRVIKRASSTPESSRGKPPPLPKRPGLRVVNRTRSTSGSSLEKPPPRLRVVNRSSSTLESSPERPPLRLRVVNRSFFTPASSPATFRGSPSPESSPQKPPIPNRLRPQNMNRNSSTPESSLDNSSRKHAQVPGQASFTSSEGNFVPKELAVWFPDTGSGCARFLDSPEDNPDGLFIRELINQYNVEYDDSRKGVPIEIGEFEAPQASTRPDIRQMVWRPPSRDSIQPHGEGKQKKNDSSDEY